MAKNSIRDYSATNSSNTDIQSIDISEGCSPAGINNAIREVMADLKDVSTGAVALESPSADSLSVTGDLTVDTSTLKVDSTNNRVGIVNASPSVELDVTGAAKISGDLTVDTDTLYADSANNRVGIGQSSPATPLHINGAPGTTTLRLDAGGTLGGSRRNWGISAEKYAAGALTIEYGSTEGAAPSNNAMTIDSSGNSYFLNTLRVVAAVGDDPAFASATSDEGVELQTDNIVVVRDSGPILYLNRIGTDGNIVNFYAQGNQEGGITVSGSTISYNGGHLARWSQLADNTKDTSIVKGTVMTNLDQMAVWHHEAHPATYYEEGDELPEGVSVGDEKTPAVAAYDEENEQLNCMAVSSVEGDPNVAGVFVNWDNDDDEFNDMNIAMTGDMVIRIASGTTVARGDLLMSAGDGTAKPQGDDIVRSKTIAKVTSTHVSHTYDDGSYLVPCVLMAC